MEILKFNFWILYRMPEQKKDIINKALVIRAIMFRTIINRNYEYVNV